MFTGIVQGKGSIQSIENDDAVWTFQIDVPDTSGLQRGASVAINGVCLTATEINGQCVAFDVIEETLNRTNLSYLNVGDAVNVERSLKMGDELGGHIVSGHVDGLAEITAITPEGDSQRYTFKTTAALMPFIAPKGSVTLDGTSLTVNEVGNDAKGLTFGVNLIPHTQDVTTWGLSKVGDIINLEIDVLARYVARLKQAEKELGDAS